MRRAALLRHLLLDLGDGVGDANLEDGLADFLRRRTGIAGEPVVHARRRVRILRAAAATTATATLPAARRARIARRLPLLRRLTGWRERHRLVDRPHVHA